MLSITYYGVLCCMYVLSVCCNYFLDYNLYSSVYFTQHPKCSTFFLILDCEAIGTAATPCLLCQPPVIMMMIVEKQMECRLAGETEVLR
jgi:hypothetical protein